MAVYNRKGDSGKTTLASPTPLAKDDIRLAAIGDCEELGAVLSLCRLTAEGALPEIINNILSVLDKIRRFILSGGMAVHLPSGADIAFLDEETAKASAEASAEAPTGACELSARLLHATTVARRCERSLVHMQKVYPTKGELNAYMNRLSSLLSALAKKADAAPAERTQSHAAQEEKGVSNAAPINTDALVCEVLNRLGGAMLNLSMAKALIEAVEAHAKRLGKAAVIAVCNAEGNPLAVHAMDGAFLVSFDVAVKKAYSATAVKMPTIKLAELVAPGGTFAGLDKITDIVTFGGGIPLYRNGTLVGGLGISGGTGEEDHALALFGADFFEKL